MEKATKSKVDMDTIVSLCKRRGFIFQSSEIYGGLGSCWDYGPLGVELKNNVKRAWWRAMVQERDDIVGLDASILMHPQTWVASGHVAGFADPMVDCKQCQRRWRADDLVPESGVESRESAAGGFDPRPLTLNPRVCPACGGELTEPRMFNLMFKTFMGPVEDEAAQVYLRPETAQGIFLNFANVLNTTRRKLPFGIAQIGKAFRNEITPGNFTFRSREFDQMEMEYFVAPGSDEEWLRRWLDIRYQWYLSLGIKEENLRLRQHMHTELAHYAKDCYDVEYLFPMGWAELEGIANRSDYDLRQHSQYSGKDLTYFEEETGQHIIPYVIEPSGGVDRATLAFLIDSYDEEPDKEGTRVVLRLHPALAPIKVAVLPLSKKEPLTVLAKEVHAQVRQNWMTQYDEVQSIGRRYRRQDEIGTPLCVTVDFQSLEDRQVTIRERDSMQQIRIPIAELMAALREKLEGLGQGGWR